MWWFYLQYVCEVFFLHVFRYPWFIFSNFSQKYFSFSLIFFSFQCRFLNHEIFMPWFLIFSFYFHSLPHTSDRNFVISGQSSLISVNSSWYVPKFLLCNVFLYSIILPELLIYEVYLIFFNVSQCFVAWFFSLIFLARRYHPFICFFFVNYWCFFAFNSIEKCYLSFNLQGFLTYEILIFFFFRFPFVYELSLCSVDIHNTLKNSLFWTSYRSSEIPSLGCKVVSGGVTFYLLFNSF